MKTLNSLPIWALRTWMPLVGLGAALALAPTSRAQSEIAPDHFDVAYNPPAGAVANTPGLSAKQRPVQVRNNKPGTHVTSQVASNKNLTGARRPELLAIQDKRKSETRNK